MWNRKLLSHLWHIRPFAIYNDTHKKSSDELYSIEKGGNIIVYNIYYVLMKLTRDACHTCIYSRMGGYTGHESMGLLTFVVFLKRINAIVQIHVYSKSMALPVSIVLSEVEYKCESYRSAFGLPLA